MKKTPEEMFDIKQKKIDARCNLKDKQIAYFNSLNAAISRCPTGTLDEIIKWRDNFLQEWEKWYVNETTPKPIDMEKAVKQGEEFIERQREQWNDGETNNQ